MFIIFSGKERILNLQGCKIFSEYRIKEDNYLESRTIGNKSCPLCRIGIEYEIYGSHN